MVGCGSSEHPTHGPGTGNGARAGSDATAGSSAHAGNGGSGNRGGSGGKGGTLAGGSGGTVVVEQAGEGGACEREVTLQAVVLGEPAPFDLVIVADHSDSLAWSRDELSAGLRDLLTHVEGRAVRVFLLTPTQYGASSADARIPLSGDSVVAWQDEQTGQPYENAVTEYSQTCTDADDMPIDCPDPRGTMPYKVHGKWDFVMPDPIAVITPDLTDAEFAAQQAAVADAILALAGSGSPEEQPLCTLSRYVSQAADALPENAVFIVISDEDDVSTPEACLSAYDAELKEFRQASAYDPCTSSCDVYRYTMTGDSYWIRHAFSCAAFTDMGDLIPGSEMMSWLNITTRSSCDGFVPGSCTAEEEAAAQEFCNSGLTLTSCSTQCDHEGAECAMEVQDPSIDACTESFTYAGVTYADLPAYCDLLGEGWHDCSGGGFNVTYTTNVFGTQSLVPLMSGTTTSAVGDYFTSRLASAFGPGKSLVEGIVFDPRFGCTLGTGQSVATNISNVIDDPSHVFSLCEDYAPALDGVLDFAQALIKTEFTLTLKNDEHVTGVVVISKDGTERTLLPSEYTFDERTGRLDIHKSSIRSTDANLRVEVTSDCRPIVR